MIFVLCVKSFYFFECDFSHRRLQEVRKWMGFRSKHIEQMDFRKLKGSQLQRNTCAIYALLIYHI